jgi:glycerophosphoryl diester phosphodiesterase
VPEPAGRPEGPRGHASGDTGAVPPDSPRRPYLDSATPLAFAHRGGAAAGLENTMTAFAAAVAAGYRYVETDVHVTADGVLVAFHDRTLDRVTDRTGRIEALPVAQVRAARINGAAGNAAGEKVPLFDELLDAWPELRLNIDIKANAAVEPFIDALRRHNAVDRVCVGAFSDARLARVRAAFGPRLATSLGPREVARLRLASLAGARVRAHPSAAAAQVPIRHNGVRIVDKRFVTTAHRSGLQVHVWTIDDPTTMSALLDLGVDGIMTDRIDVLRDVLTARGSWAA